jgi:peptidyl-prolyl cis-trans isomerase SurA
VLKPYLRKQVVASILFLSFGAGTATAQLASHTPTEVASKPFNRTIIQPSDKPVARVNDVVLTQRDLLKKMYAIFPYAQQHNGGFPKAMEQDIRHGAMKMIVFEELCYQEAVRRQMTVAPARIDKAVASIRADLKKPGEFQAFLDQEAGGTEKGLRVRVHRMMLVEDLLKIEITNKSVLTPVQLRAYYDAHRVNFKLPDEVSFQTISVVPPANSNAAVMADARKRADDLLKQAKASKSYEEFGLLAEKSSDDDFRVNMGYRKPVELSKLPKEIANKLANMKPGDVSDIVPIDGGFTILRLKEHTLPTTVKFEQVKVDLKKKLQQQKQEDLRAALNEKLRAKAKVQEL